ncbi:site-specific integrase [Levilactobacillus brevis]|uniref:site-specific integrase n=1 Tax=Levilactobacillus brevis TaxID=1580 RepID=UPI00111B745A|nr:site-specific integrase [Levilactobacillus brevis]QCZ46813.1 Hypothetical protein UCCLB556_1938 [Levilactobacillus brevis]
MSRVIKRTTTSGLPWQAEFTQGSGKRRLRLKRVFASKREANQWLVEVTATHSKSLYFDERMLFSNFFLVWYRLYRKKGLSPATQLTYDATYKHIEQYLPTLTLGEVSRPILQGFFNVLGKSHAKETLRKDLTHIKSALTDGVADGAIAKNSAARIRLFADKTLTKTMAHKLMAKEEYQAVRTALWGWTMTPDEIPMMVLLLISQTGLRVGEALALQRQDINWEKSVLHIDKSWDSCSKQIKEPKTANSIRYVPITDKLKERLSMWLEVHDSWLLAKGVANPDEFLFLTGKGTLNHATDINYHYHQLQKRLGFSYQYSTHTLRHFLVSQLIRDPQISLTFVSRLLGHSTETITQRYYLGLIPDEMLEQQEQVATAISNI